MVTRKLTLTMVAASLLVFSFAALSEAPQGYGEGRRAAHALLADWKARGGVALESFVPAAPASRLTAPAAEPVPATDRDPLVGTWIIDVPNPDGSIAFSAFQTFGADGTFVETSTLLGQLPEGPAHGNWRRSGDGYLLTFQVWSFDPEGQPAGKVRVRVFLRLTGPRSLEAETVVDVVTPDGQLLEAVATGPYRGRRMAIVAP